MKTKFKSSFNSVYSKPPGLIESFRTNPYSPVMPVYSLRCPACARTGVMFRRISERHDVPECGCGVKFERIIDKPMVMPEITPYESPNGGLISSRQERIEDLKKSRAYPWEPGIEQDIARKREYEIEKGFKPVSEAVDNIVRDMVVSGKLESTNA